MSADDVQTTVLGMWQALSDRDWEKLTTFLSDDCIYLDMPVGPAAAAPTPVSATTTSTPIPVRIVASSRFTNGPSVPGGSLRPISRSVG